jgi:acetyl-CoA synthetase (ADP-forming)
MHVLDTALAENRKALSEHESKQILAEHGIPVCKEVLITDRSRVVEAAQQVGYPLVMKACSPDISHKTEKGLVRTGLRTEADALYAFDEIVAAMDESMRGGILIQEMIHSPRELMVGLTRDDSFGPCVLFGLGGIFSEALSDVCFRMAPLTANDAAEMMQEIKGSKILGAVRGLEPVDTDALAQIIVSLGQIGLDYPQIKEIDINPVLIAGNKPVAVDALIVAE